jgi:phage terminase large subunit-like protein
MNLNIRDKEYENLRLDFTRLKMEFDKATTQNFSSDSEHGAVIDQLRSKTILLISKLEVLVNEISKTEKTSENTVNVLKRWIDAIP